MRKLTKSGIIALNEEAIINDGGNFMPPDNLLNESNLDYLVDIVDAEMFGEPLYPEIYDKAAVYLFNIISNHIFTDGNKRTGLEASIAFLKLNDYRLRKDLGKDNLLAFVLKVASGESSLDECREWFKDNIVPI